MAKRLKTYRIDGDLDDAAAAKAARIGCTVTDVIVRAIEEFVKEEPTARKPSRSRNAASLPKSPLPLAAGCPHRLPPGAYCKTCDRTK